MRRNWFTHRRGSRPGLMVFFVMLVGFAGPAAAFAQDATPGATPEASPGASPIASPVPGAGGPDLAAMVLRSADLDDDFGLTEGALWDIDTEVATVAEPLGLDPDDLRDELVDAGWQTRYLAFFGVPSEDDPNFLARGITSYATAYADGDGAETGFELTEDESDNPDAEDVEDAPELGDQSELTRSAGIDEATGNESISLDLTFRIDNIVAGVTVNDFTGEEPDIDELADLGELVRERVEAALSGEAPGLFNQILRIDAGDGATTQYTSQYYQLIDSETLRFFDEPAGAAEQRADFLTENDVESSYQYEGYFLPEDVSDPNESLAVVNRVYAFASEDDAAAFVQTAADDLVENPDPYASVEALDDLPEFDGEVSGVAYDFPITDDLIAPGFRYWIQVGANVVSVQADIVDGVDEDGVLALAEAQIACVEQDAPCEPLTLPDDLLN